MDDIREEKSIETGYFFAGKTEEKDADYSVGYTILSLKKDKFKLDKELYEGEE